MKIISKQLFLKLFVVFISFVVVIAIIEIVFRLIGYDFDKKQQAFDNIPICYRQPIKPAGEIYFVRPGTDEWTGNVLSTGNIIYGYCDTNFAREPERTITYDKDGFRNPNDLTNWDIVVIGDSYIELGYLNYDDLYTTLLGKLLNVKVKNLGVGFTGTLSHNYYFEQYGKSPATKHAILVFSEGNDIEDLLIEYEQLKTFNSTGKRSFRDIKFIKQTSFIKAIYHLLTRVTEEKEILRQDGYFVSNTKRIPVNINYAPKGSEDISDETNNLLDSVLSAFSNSARASGIIPWLVYMPCKHRVFHGYIEHNKDVPKYITDWQPTDLPQYIEKLCNKDSIHYINIYDRLREETIKGNLTYNAMFDTHLNKRGSHIVAEVIAEKFKEYQSNKLVSQKE